MTSAVAIAEISLHALMRHQCRSNRSSVCTHFEHRFNPLSDGHKLRPEYMLTYRDQQKRGDQNETFT